jgi:hypothetical protein
VAEAFVDLQEARHGADYDLTLVYSRQEAEDLVRRFEGAFDSWKRCWGTSPANAYLVALLIHGQLKG